MPVSDDCFVPSTTSRPKGVEHTHRSIINACALTLISPPAPTQQRRLADFSYSQIESKLLFLDALTTRHYHIILDTTGHFSISTYLASLEYFRPERLAVSKRTLDALAFSGRKPDLSYVRVMLSGAQTIPTKTRLAMKELCHGRDVLAVVYSTTESLFLTSKIPTGTPAKSSCVGQLAPGAQGKVMDEVGNPVEPGRQGRLLYRVTTIMKGYYRDAEQTASKIGEDGWYDTRDLGFVDPVTDDWHVTGRTKEIIKVHGMSVSPNAIEETLLKIPNVAIAVVVSVMREDGEELPTALLVRGSEGGEQRPQEADVHRFVEKEMNKDHQITGGLIWLDNAEVPYGGNGKIERRSLKELAQKMYDQGNLKGQYVA